VHVTGGVITSLERGGDSGVEEVDAGALLVLPGGVDAHVHSRDPGFPEKEDFLSLTAAAAAGGITTVVDMPNTVPAVESAAVFLEKVEIASSRALVDFALWGLLGSSSRPEDVDGLFDAGAVGLKAFLGYALRRSNRQVVYTPDLDDPELEAPPGYGTIARLAPDLARLGAPLAVHSEDPDILRSFARPVRTYADLLASRPALAEAVAVAALGVVSQRTGLEIQIVHLSSALGLAAARDARRAGARLVLETCPQYLWLSDEDAGRLGQTLKMYPPVRTAADRAALIEALRGGLIERVGTDHAPHSDDEKLDRSLEEALPGSASSSERPSFSSSECGAWSVPTRSITPLRSASMRAARSAAVRTGGYILDTGPRRSASWSFSQRYCGHVSSTSRAPARLASRAAARPSALERWTTCTSMPVRCEITPRAATATASASAGREESKSW